MLTGRRFRLTKPTLGIDLNSEKPVATQVPAGSIIEVTGGPSATDLMVRVQWEARTLTMFVFDIEERGVSVKMSKFNHR